jgi:uncharacterized protein (DUF302 family)
MLAAPDSALDLPLKILIAEEPSGSTRVSYNSPAYLQARYGLAPEVLATAVSILVFTESSMPSGIFLKKMPPCTIFK